jgi:hypothetical protein
MAQMNVCKGSLKVKAMSGAQTTRFCDKGVWKKARRIQLARESLCRIYSEPGLGAARLKRLSEVCPTLGAVYVGKLLGERSSAWCCPEVGPS